MQGKVFGISQTSKNYIINMLTQHYNESEATTLYLRHQLSLEEHLRVEHDLTEEEMEKTLKHLVIQSGKIFNALQEVQDLHVKSDE